MLGNELAMSSLSIGQHPSHLLDQKIEVAASWIQARPIISKITYSGLAEFPPAPQPPSTIRPESKHHAGRPRHSQIPGPQHDENEISYMTSGFPPNPTGFSNCELGLR